MTAQDSEISSLQSNLTEGFDTVLSTQEFRCDLSGSQDADSMSGEERLIQHNMGEVQVRRITITQAITLLLRNPLVRGDPRQSGQRALWRWCFIPARSAQPLLGCPGLTAGQGADKHQCWASGWAMGSSKTQGAQRGEKSEPDSLFQKSFLTPMWLLASQSYESALQICLWPKNSRLK